MRNEPAFRALRIRIVGGSLGGLFAGALLAQDGHDVRIYERSATGLAGRGAGLVGQHELFAVLRQLGCEHVARVGVLAFERIHLDRDGHVSQRQAAPQTQISWDLLYRTVRDRFDDTRYLIGRAVRSVAEDGRLVFEDGGEEAADLVIGADGIGSVVRPVVAGGPASNGYAGYVAWRGLVPEHDLPAAAAVLIDRLAFYTMPQSHALGYLVPGPQGETTAGARRYNWVWYRRVAPADLAATLTGNAGHAHPYSLAPGQVPGRAAAALLNDARWLLPPPFAAAVAAETRPFIQAVFDYEAPVMARGRLALLGDAAFVVRPHTAMGIAKAAADAMTLRRYLAEVPDLGAALSLYDRERRATGRAIADYGRRLGAMMD